ncbi:MAG: undecaprenyl phosphate translocase family protein [Bacillota bacterium]
MLLKILKGTFIGAALILPGLSAGTVIVILGFYREFLEDLSNLRFKPYLPMLAGAIAGALLGISVISYLLAVHNQAIMAFLLGMLLASVPTVLNCQQKIGFAKRTNLPIINSPAALQSGRLKLRAAAKKFVWPTFIGFVGFIITWFIICEPTRTFTVFPSGGLLHFFIGGTLASATMLLPGVSGSSVLVILNLYDDVIIAVTSWQWLKLFSLGAGFIVGLFGLARLLSALYRRYQTAISFLLAGLILGSTRILLPGKYTPAFFLFALLGILTISYFTRKSAS